MAIDTRQKRMSMMSFVSGRGEVPLFEADSAVDLDDRVHLLGGYSGIVYQTYTMIAVVGIYIGKQPP